MVTYTVYGGMPEGGQMSGTMEDALSVFSPFNFLWHERNKSGNTPCRSLAATARAFHAWCDRNPRR